jgi:hypothetical protein
MRTAAGGPTIVVGHPETIHIVEHPSVKNNACPFGITPNGQLIWRAIPLKMPGSEF